MQQQIYFVTGAAGFIGFSVCQKLLDLPNIRIIGLDNLNDYYDVNLKLTRLSILKQKSNFTFIKGDITHGEFIKNLVLEYLPSVVLHFAAQPGVRFSLQNPHSYIDTNITGFVNVLQACSNVKKMYPSSIRHFLYASSSSVYGNNKQMPYSCNQKTDCPASVYAVTKKTGELMAYTYSSLYRIPVTGMRFFTVYGPWGRPDMAYYKFANQMCKGQPIQIFNEGNMYRDFTYIDDVVTVILTLIDTLPNPDHANVRSAIYNIAASKPEKLSDFIRALETNLIQENVIKKPVQKEFLPMQPGDVFATYADISLLKSATGYAPKTDINQGLQNFVHWYKEYYKL